MRHTLCGVSCVFTCLLTHLRLLSRTELCWANTRGTHSSGFVPLLLTHPASPLAPSLSLYLSPSLNPFLLYPRSYMCTHRGATHVQDYGENEVTVWAADGAMLAVLVRVRARVCVRMCVCTDLFFACQTRGGFILVFSVIVDTGHDRSSFISPSVHAHVQLAPTHVHTLTQVRVISFPALEGASR